MTVEKEEKIKERIETEEKDEKEEKKGRKKRKALKLVPEFPGPSKNDRKEKIVTVENKKVDKKGFPLITFYQEIKKAKSGRKKRSQDEDGFTCVETKAKRVKRVVEDFPTAKEREELVLRENRFWLPKDAKANSDFSFGVGKSIQQLDGHDSFSESEDEVPSKKRKVRAKGSKGDKGSKVKGGKGGKAKGSEGSKGGKVKGSEGSKCGKVKGSEGCKGGKAKVSEGSIGCMAKGFEGGKAMVSIGGKGGKVKVSKGVKGVKSISVGLGGNGDRIFDLDGISSSLTEKSDVPCNPEKEKECLSKPNKEASQSLPKLSQSSSQPNSPNPKSDEEEDIFANCSPVKLKGLSSIFETEDSDSEMLPPSPVRNLSHFVFSPNPQTPRNKEQQHTPKEFFQHTKCPQEKCNYHSSNVRNMKRHLRKHKKLTKDMVEKEMTKLLQFNTSQETMQRGIDELHLDETEENEEFRDLEGLITPTKEDNFLECSDSEEETYKEKIAEFDKQIEDAVERKLDLKTYLVKSKAQTTDRMQNLYSNNPTDLMDQIQKELLQAKEQEEAYMQAIEEQHSIICSIKERRQMIVDLLSQKETRRTAHKTMQDYDTINQTLTELQPASPQALTELQPPSPQALTEPQPASPQNTPMSNATQTQTMKRSLYEKVDKPL